MRLIKEVDAGVKYSGRGNARRLEKVGSQVKPARAAKDQPKDKGQKMVGDLELEETGVW